MFIRRLCILQLLALTVFQTSCRNDNGTSENGGPVNHAPAGKSSDQSLDTKKQSVLNRLKKTADSGTESGHVSADFHERAKELGIDFTLSRDAVKNRFYFPEVMGAGIGFVDFDLDGYWDLFVGNGDILYGPPAKSNQLYRNRQGTEFENSTSVAIEPGFGFAQGIAVGDFDCDGFDDIFVSNFGQNFLMINLGDGSFVQRPIGEIANEPSWSASAIPLDVDADGDLDVVATCYLDWSIEKHHPCIYKGVLGYCGPGTYEGTEDLVYINNGDGTFSEDHVGKGIDRVSKGLVICAADFDDDRVPEIYIGSDLTNNFFYHRSKSDQQYTEIGLDAGLATSKNGLAEATMGFAIRDFNNDQRTDLFLTHYYKNKNTLYLNEGDLLFKDASYETRIKALSFDFIGFGTIPIDYDNDADFDLFISNGHVLGETIPPFRLKPQLLINDRARFFDVSQDSGNYFNNEFAGRSVSSCDFDNDGDVDIAVGHLDKPMAFLVNETVTEGKFLQIQLLDPDRRDLTGTSVIVKTGNKTIKLPVVRGESYLASVDPRLSVGVGQEELVAVSVKWSFGGESTFEKLKTNARWLLSSTSESIELK